VAPSHLLIAPSDNSNLINISDFSKIGLSSLKESSAFKKVQYHSKSPSSQLFDSSTIGYSKFDVLNKLYNTTSNLTNSKDYYTDRQDNYTSLLASQLSNKSSLESKSVDKYLSYNFNVNSTKSQLNTFNSLVNSSDVNYHTDSNSASRLKNNLHSNSEASAIPSVNSEASAYNINNTSDGKYNNNAIKPLLAPTNSRKSAIEAAPSSSLDLSDSISSSTANSRFSNLELSTKFKDLKSANLGFLSSDKNIRLLSKLHTSKGQFNLSDKNSNLSDIISEFNNNSAVTKELAVYNSSTKDWVSENTVNKLSSLNNSTGSLNSPVYSNDPN
jgi:hypothetical protein